MKRLIFAVTTLIALTAGISLYVHFLGGYPARDGIAGLRADVYAIITKPMFFPLLSALFSVPILISKRTCLMQTQGKALIMPIASALVLPIVLLLVQILLPLKAYDVISASSGDLLFHGFAIALFAVLGNYVVTVPPGSKLGLRNRWTLSHDAVWAKTHRFLGTNIMMAALLIGPAAAFLDRNNATLILVGAVMLVKAVTYFYSRSLAGKQQFSHTPAN